MPFLDRAQAGRRLAGALGHFEGTDAVVFALPRGGVVVAEPVAAALHAPLDLILVRKIGAPFQPELAMGAVAEAGAEPIVVRNEDVIAFADISEAAFKAAAARECAELERRRALYFANRTRADARGRLAIVVDDGVATGATTRAALAAARAQKPKRLILAVPVAPAETLDALRGEADEVVALATPEPFVAIGCYYRDFRQIDDAEVVAALDRFSAKPG